MQRKLQLDRVYPITDSGNHNAFSHFQLVEKFLEGGARFFQIREKSLSDSLLYNQLLQIKDLCRRSQAQFLINDRIDLALSVEADGVHLGQNDPPVETARRLLGDQALIGLSTHDPDQFHQAQTRDIDYVAIGPIFPTSTKQSENPPLGTDLLPDLVATSRHPVVAIGGIHLGNAPALWKAGLDSVAVISDIVNSPELAHRVRRYLKLAEEVLH